MKESPIVIDLDELRVQVPSLLSWYDRHARKMPWRVSPNDRQRGLQPNPYKVWLSEIMLQQTTVTAVRDYFLKFVGTWPTVQDLAEAKEDDVLSAWAGLGYYARARNLHKCARVVAESGGKFPTGSIDLQALPGIGPYTSAAIAAICADEQIGVLDGNVERVIARHVQLSVPVREVKPQMRAALTQIVPKRSGDFAQAMMDLGATICAPKRAACDVCPISNGCSSASGNPLEFPVKPEKAAKPHKFGTAFVIVDQDGNVLLLKRPDSGLLAKMDEVPNSDWDLREAGRPRPPVDADWVQKGTIRHVFTHFSLELDVWVARVDREKIEAVFPTGSIVKRDQLPDRAVPKLFEKVLVQAEVWPEPKPAD